MKKRPAWEERGVFFLGKLKALSTSEIKKKPRKRNEIYDVLEITTKNYQYSIRLDGIKDLLTFE